MLGPFEDALPENMSGIILKSDLFKARRTKATQLRNFESAHYCHRFQVDCLGKDTETTGLALRKELTKPSGWPAAPSANLQENPML